VDSFRQARDQFRQGVHQEAWAAVDVPHSSHREARHSQPRFGRPETLGPKDRSRAAESSWPQYERRWLSAAPASIAARKLY
jgi:hypothetical protein